MSAQAERNKALVLEAMTALFQRKDPLAVDRLYAADYVQHNPDIPQGRAALAKLVAQLPSAVFYEPGMIIAEGDYVAIHGRIQGWAPKPQVVVDIFRIQDGRLAEHWDVLQDEVAVGASSSGIAMFAPNEAATQAAFNHAAAEAALTSNPPPQETTMSKKPKIGLDALLRPADSIVVLIDHQPFQFANLHSHEQTLIINNVVALAKTAKVFDVPTILTTVIQDRGGFILKGLQDVFPEQTPIDRTFINTWEDPKVTDLVKKSGRKQLVLAGLYTEICVAMPAIQALEDGYDVFVVTDACGGVSAEAHDMAVRRMMQAGCVPITTTAVMGEWQRDWARTETAAGAANVMLEHGGGGAVALAWELQLLGAPVSSGR